MIIKSIFEFAAIVAVLYGIYHEDKLIEWEDSLFGKMKGVRKNDTADQR